MSNKKGRPVVLSIAGFDPCGGAGVLADIKTLEQHKVLGMAVLTANTVQTEDTLLSVGWIDPEVIRKGIEAIMMAYEISVVKIGIVKNIAMLEMIIHTIRACRLHSFILWDPVIRSTSGFLFFNAQDHQDLNPVINKIDLLTPNYDEYLLLRPSLDEHYSNALLIKGGHRRDRTGTDILRENNTWHHIYPLQNSVYEKHGSGCVLSSAIAAHLASGKDIETACRQAKWYTEHFLNSHTSLLGFHTYVR